ncbi:MAG: CPBP family intramembrane metalloprotease [Deltaproteobacteria bacterium]|nr:CPBP family intramembrane metalloprotease [Deltaproteobacteria bacterium]
MSSTPMSTPSISSVSSPGTSRKGMQHFAARPVTSSENAAPSAVGLLLMSSQWARWGEIGAVFGAAILALFLGKGLAGEGPITSQIPVLLANALMLFAVWLGLRVRGQRLDHFGFAFRSSTWRRSLWVGGQSILTFVAAIAAFVVGAVIMANLMSQPQQADMSGYNAMAGNLPLLLVSLPTVWFFASFGEEVIYRGFLVTRISELGSWSKPWIAVAASAVLFGVAHFSWGLAGMVQTTCMGLALAVAYLVVGRNLWVTILAHGAMDTILFLQMYLQPS